MDVNNRPISICGSFRSAQFSGSLADYKLGLRQSWHCHDEAILTLILAGYVRERVQREDAVAGPLKIGLKPAGLRHADYFWDHGVRAVRIALPASFFHETGMRMHMPERWQWIHGSRAVAPLLRLAHGLREATQIKTELTEHVYEALAALLPTVNIRHSAEPPLWLRRSREYLTASYADGVRLTQLALEAGVHPVYFARQFRRFYGCSVGRYVRQLQFRAAASLIAERREENLALVAYLVGFSDQAHLTRAFTNEFGITPGQFRHTVS